MTPERVRSRTVAQVRSALLVLVVSAGVLLGAGVGAVVVGMPQTEGAVVALFALLVGAGAAMAAIDWLADAVAARLVDGRLRALRARQELAWAQRVRAEARDEEQQSLDGGAPAPVVNPLDHYFRARA